MSVAVIRESTVTRMAKKSHCEAMVSVSEQASQKSCLELEHYLLVLMLYGRSDTIDSELRMGLSQSCMRLITAVPGVHDTLVKCRNSCVALRRSIWDYNLLLFSESNWRQENV